MEIIILENQEAVARKSAQIVADLIHLKPDCVLGLATGSTPLLLYRELISLYQKDQISFKKVTTFNLDEYVGIPDTHPQSYRFFMNQNFFHNIDIDPSNTHVPDGMMENPMDSGPSYEKLIRSSGGIDLQILGIGANGHIGFNEPTSSLGSRTRVKTLTEKTMLDNSRFFSRNEFQPFLSITMGISTIMEARRVILLATGPQKAEAVAAAVEGPVSSMCPASALQWHEKTTFIIDEPASALLRRKEYYKFVFRQQDDLERKFGDSRLREGL